MLKYITIIFISLPVFAKPVPIKDNILFGFEKCKELSVDLEKGQLIEAKSSSFDLHCKKIAGEAMNFKCGFFETGSSNKFHESIFTGGSNLGIGELKDTEGQRLSFLIGKTFASFESGAKGNKVCAGVFIFEQEALKQKSSL